MPPRWPTTRRDALDEHWTRYCDSTCQQDHWRRGHKQECKKIFRGGGAEKYYANERYKELEKKAVEKCAAAAVGKTCYICLDDKPGLVHGGCDCCGDEGFAHLSCLVRQAQAHSDHEGNLGPGEETDSKYWMFCRLCSGIYFDSDVAGALLWAGYKTYAGPPRAPGWQPACTLRNRTLARMVEHMKDYGDPKDTVAVCEAYIADIKLALNHLKPMPKALFDRVMSSQELIEPFKSVIPDFFRKEILE